MRSESEIRRAFFLLGAVLELNNSATTDPLPEESVKVIKHGRSVLGWAEGASNNFSVFLDSLESQLAAADLQIVECEGGARLLPLRDNHRTKRKASWKH